MKKIDIESADLERLKKIIREETGNDVQDRNNSMVESRIRRRLSFLGLSTMAEYWAYFSANEVDERGHLRGLMTTHHTFFFREYVHFEMIENWIEANLPRLRERFHQEGRGVQVWSAACSRGQEVYSLAMFLHRHFEAKYQIPFEVFGTDIDADSVNYAKNGVYPINEVNSVPQEFLGAYFKKGTGEIAQFAAIKPVIRERVRFSPLNLFHIPEKGPKGPFDLILCRNVFIYFSEEDIQKVTGYLLNLLDQGGMLVSGISEPLRFVAKPFLGLGSSCYLRPLPGAAPQIEKTPPRSVPERVEAPLSAVKPLRPEPSPTAISAFSSPAMPVLAAKEKKYRVLCVDDSAVIRSLMKKIFAKDANCLAVETAEHGRDARARLDRGSFDLITLDIHMPEVNGIEFLQQHYRKGEDPPVIMVSSVNRADEDLATKAMSLGAFDYVEKPSMNNIEKVSDELLTKVRMALRSHGLSETPVTLDFQKEISKKIVVPDASQCARFVFVDAGSVGEFKNVLRGQMGEVRSPALVVVPLEAEALSKIQNTAMEASDKPVSPLRSVSSFLKPNAIHICEGIAWEDVLAGLKVKRISFQILSAKLSRVPKGYQSEDHQWLVSESIHQSIEPELRKQGVRVGDVTPATSFPSLSVEFFAKVRKAAA